MPCSDTSSEPWFWAAWLKATPHEPAGSMDKDHRGPRASRVAKLQPCRVKWAAAGFSLKKSGTRHDRVLLHLVCKQVLFMPIGPQNMQLLANDDTTCYPCNLQSEGAIFRRFKFLTQESIEPRHSASVRSRVLHDLEGVNCDNFVFQSVPAQLHLESSGICRTLNPENRLALRKPGQAGEQHMYTMYTQGSNIWALGSLSLAGLFLGT